MNRNTLLLRLVVLAGAMVVGFVLLSGLLTPRQGGEAEEARLLPEEALRAQLAEAGQAVAALERQGGLVRVQLEGGGELWLDGETGRAIDLPERRGEALQPVQARRLLQAEGYSDIGAVTWRRGAFETRARDAAGRLWALRLDTYSGAVLEREPL